MGIVIVRYCNILSFDLLSLGPTLPSFCKFLILTLWRTHSKQIARCNAFFYWECF